MREVYIASIASVQGETQRMSFSFTINDIVKSQGKHNLGCSIKELERGIVVKPDDDIEENHIANVTIRYMKEHDLWMDWMDKWNRFSLYVLYAGTESANL